MTAEEIREEWKSLMYQLVTTMLAHRLEGREAKREGDVGITMIQFAKRTGLIKQDEFVDWFNTIQGKMQPRDLAEKWEGERAMDYVADGIIRTFSK